MKRLMLLALSSLLAGCQMIPADSRSAADTQVGSLKARSAEWRGLKFARNRCSDCHAVEHGEASPVSNAPTFASVANTPGLTKASLNHWLRTYSAHPREMYFEIPAEHIDDLVAYMLTLNTNGLRPSRVKIPAR